MVAAAAASNAMECLVGLASPGHHNCKSAPPVGVHLFLLLEPPCAVVIGYLKGFISIGVWVLDAGTRFDGVRPLAPLSASPDGPLHFRILSCVDLIFTSRELSISRLMKLESFKFIPRAFVGVTVVGYNGVGAVVVRQVMVEVVVDAVSPNMIVLALRHDVVVGVVKTRDENRAGSFRPCRRRR